MVEANIQTVFLAIESANEGCGQNNPPSIKGFGDGGLNAAECRDFGRGGGAERPVADGQSPVSRRLAGAGAEVHCLAAVIELFSGVRGQAALR